MSRRRFLTEGEIQQAIRSGARTFWSMMGALKMKPNQFASLHAKLQAMRRNGRVWFDRDSRTWKCAPKTNHGTKHR